MWVTSRPSGNRGGGIPPGRFEKTRHFGDIQGGGGYRHPTYPPPPLDTALPRSGEPQLQVGKNHSYLFNLGPNNCKYWCWSTHLISDKGRTIRYLGGGGSRVFVVVCFPYYVGDHLVFFSGLHIFHKFRQQSFFLPTFSTNFFFWLLWRQIFVFNLFLASPPQISNGASLTLIQVTNKMIKTIIVVLSA